MEYEFKQILIKKEINDDSPLTSYYPVQAQYDVIPDNRWGLDIGKFTSHEKGGAWGYNPPIKVHEDLLKLVRPRFIFNQARTEHLFEDTQQVIGDILPVKMMLDPGYDNATLGTTAADLRGLEQMMLDMICEPSLMHKLMAYLRDVKQEELNIWEQNPLLSPNTTGPMLCSDSIGSVGDKISLKNCWCAGNSQEFDQVSPAMWEEFCLDYQRPIFERFGYVCYGCCENLTHKIDGVLSIPNLRIFVCSAWTDIDVVLNKINKNYCIMWRQKASDVVCTDDLKTLRNQMEEGLRKLQGQYYQIVLRELQTLAGNLDRLHVWTAMAKELAAKYT
jgi:hypothetical protein